MEKFNLKITSLSDRSVEIDEFLKHDGFPPRSTGFLTLDKYYQHKDAGVTDWTGEPSSGKTYFCLELLFQLSERYGQINALYVPDLGSYVDIISKLIKMYIGKDIHSRYHNRVTMTEIFNSIPFLSKHFMILERQTIRETISPTQIWEFCCDWKGSDGTVINNVLIDSWKNLFHDFGKLREDQYLDYVLSYRNELSEVHKKHFHTIAHSTKMEMEDKADGTRRRRVPSAYDIKGGGSWYANGKNIITVDRPDKTSTGVDLYVWKTKPEDVGLSGVAMGEIYLDRERGRYYELWDGIRRNPFESKKFSFISNPSYKFPKVEKLVASNNQNFNQDEDIPF